MSCMRHLILAGIAICAMVAALPSAPAVADDSVMLKQLDAPLLFVRRNNYQGIHIYDTYYQWRPGGGIYLLENPAAPPAQQVVRPVIDAQTAETLGEGMYSDPDLSCDARRVLFCFKGQADGHTSIYEIGIDGTGLRRLTDPGAAEPPSGRHKSQHDLAPAYLPDGRIVFTSTRPNGLVPCNNTGVDIMHVMNADGSDIHTISVNNVNEFDPSVLPDGRILHGRWEYVDKTALTQQSVWTIFPDGTSETAFFANNMVRPEAVLDARGVPGSPHLIIGTFARHNSTPRGSIAFVSSRLGKNNPDAILNLDHPEDPTHDQGESCEPWPLSAESVLYSGRPAAAKFNAIILTDRSGKRIVVRAEADIDCHSPMLVKARPCPPVLGSHAEPSETTGRFFVQDVYRGLDGVDRGDVKWLRVIEETSRTSATLGGAYNQTFMVSAALAFSVKNYLGVVPVQADGSAYFEVPSGRAIFLQALDNEGRLVQSMRTFVQAAPGVTRSCIGCHEYKYGTTRAEPPPSAFARKPDRPQPESWGTGFVDYPSMVQPILDRHCVKCHGGAEGFAAKLDLSGGWTEHFNISYENLVNRRENQVMASLIAAIDCMNGTALFSAQRMPPRSHGSGAAPLAEILVSGHKGWIPDLTRKERDLIMAWIDTNGLYHGSWDYSEHGCSVKTWGKIHNTLAAEMQTAGCTQCHSGIESDWINLERPELSRMIRAPLAKGDDGLGLGWCRQRKLDPRQRRVRLMVTGGYIHGVMPTETFNVPKIAAPQEEGELADIFASADDPRYQAMLRIIQEGRREALASPRVDMPGANVMAGECRQFIAPPLPQTLPTLVVTVDGQGVVRLEWERTARTIGLASELHRGATAHFEPDKATLLASTRMFQYADDDVSQGKHHYALILVSGSQRSEPIHATVDVPTLPPPPVPTSLRATPGVGRVDLQWHDGDIGGVKYHVYRGKSPAEPTERLTAEPIPLPRYCDTATTAGTKHLYTVRAVNRRGTESAAASPAMAAALPEIKEPMFTARFADDVDAKLYGGGIVKGTVHGKASVADGSLDLSQAGHVSFAHRPEFDLTGAISMACWVKMGQADQMPVVVGCGHWNSAGWFLQRIGSGWRWHVGGINCDGGKPAADQWTHLLATFDGQTARLFQDGHLVGEKSGAVNRKPFAGPLLVGQYSGTPGPPFQVFGRIGPVKVFNRAVRAEEVAEEHAAGQD